MTVYSIYNTLIALPAAQAASGKPLSARMMNDVSNNAQFLLDYSGQTRINWSHVNDEYAAEIDGWTTYRPWMTCVVPWAYMQGGRPFSPYLVVTGQTNGVTTLYVDVVYAPAGNPKGDVYADEAASLLGLGIFSTTDSASDTVIIENLTDWTYFASVRNRAALLRSYPARELDDAGDWLYGQYATQAEIRVTIWAKGTGRINHVMLREYCV